MTGEPFLRVGIIGVGNIGSVHAACIAAGKIPGMRLAALCDTDGSKRARLAQQYPDVPVFADASALLASGLADAVILSTPHYFHPPLAIEAFRTGHHVLTEKPAGVATGRVREMIAAAQQSGKRFGIMFNQRTDPLFRKARELVQSGALGVPKRLVWLVTNWYRTQAYYDSGDWRATWNGEGGGVLLNQAPHNLDLWQWIFGMPCRVRAFCGVGKYHNIRVEDDATIYAEYENGATAVFITTTGELPGTNRLEISGDLGKLVLEDGVLRLCRLSVPERSFCFSVKENSGLPEMTEEEFRAPAPEGHALILADFAAACLTGAPMLSPGEDGLFQLSLSNAAYLSSWENRTVTLPLCPQEEEKFEAHLARLCKEERTASVNNLGCGPTGASAGTQPADNPGGGPDTQLSYEDRWKVRW